MSLKEILKIKNFPKGDKFWNKDLYDNRVIFNPYTAAG